MGQFYGLLFMLLFSGYCTAGPVREDVFEETKVDENVCEVKNVTFAKGDVVPDVAPCETCVCEPPEVKCSPIKCQPNNGCKIIQQSGKCCPEYKCDCEYEGNTYNNGEKLHNPSSPCQVCYCRGGEIMCNSITCYRRDDCEPQHVEGQCCPKYGHCPPKNSSSVIAIPADPSGSSTKREMQPWLLTKSVNLQTTETPSKYPQTIKIVEILPTQAPARSVEVSLVPRIITNSGPDRLTPAESSTSSYSDAISTETYGEAEPIKMSPGPSDIEEESVQPDSETYTTLLPQMVDVTAMYEELSASSSGATEGTGYDLETGGTFFPNATKDESSEEKDDSEGTSEEKGRTTTTVVPLDGENPKDNEDEVAEGQNHTMSAHLKVRTTLSEVTDALTENSTYVADSNPTSESPPSTGKLELITRHGLTIPPILNLNHQFHHLTLGGTGEEVEEKSVVKIGVYNPTMPGEVSNMVTVIKNEEASPSASSATTQVLLTPQDLKTLAEMIIKEKIKAPNEKLELGTTPLTTAVPEETTVASPVSNDAGNETATEGEVEETTPNSVISSGKSLTKEEEKAQAVIDRLTSNVHVPLQGIEVVDANETTTTESAEVLPSNHSEILSNKDAEWVEVSNSTVPDDKVRKADEVVVELTTEADPATTESSSNDSSTEKHTPATETPSPVPSAVPTDSAAKTRGSLRQIEELVSQLPDDHATDRRTRITAAVSDDDNSKHISMAMFDEKDQTLVDNFFKKALDFQ